MSKKGRGRRKSTRPSRKSRPPVGGQATAAVDALVQAAPPSRLELVQEPTLELTESSRLELVPDAADSSPAAASAPSSGTQAVAVSDPFRDEPQASADPDEISIPPIGDVHAEQFFSEGDLGAHLKGEIDDDEELWTPDRELAARRTMPAVVQRRERYIRYVKWAVVGGAVVCLAALGRAAVSRLSSDVDARMTAASPGPLAVATVAPEPAKAEPAKAAEPPAAAEPVKAAEAPAAAEPVKAAEPPAAAEPAKAAEPPAAAPEPVKAVEPPAAAEPAKAAEPPAAAEPAKAAAEPAKADATQAPAPPARDAKAAAGHKSRSRGLLEAGAAGQAVRAGEQAVAADPSDGEAWLILGAAYQELGNVAQARRCYASCLKQGTRGPLSECRAMLR